MTGQRARAVLFEQRVTFLARGAPRFPIETLMKSDDPPTILPGIRDDDTAAFNRDRVLFGRFPIAILYY